MLLQDYKDSHFSVELHLGGPTELNKSDFEVLPHILAELGPFEVEQIFLLNLTTSKMA